MRFTVAVIAAAVLIAGMFLFSAMMQKQIAIWADRGAALSGFQLLLVNEAQAWTQYWYLGAAAILGLCLAILLLWRPADSKTYGD